MWTVYMVCDVWPCMATIPIYLYTYANKKKFDYQKVYNKL